jgi:outer membrane immunogenic protein
MIRIRSALIALAVVAGIGAGVVSAQAGGPRSIKDAPYGGINWAGFYVGIQGGYGWGDTSHNFSGLNAGEWDANGGVFGVTWGTNWQRGNWVYGFESDFSFSSIDGSFAGVGCNTGACFTDLRNLSTSRVRLGYAMDNRLVYVTGGLAYGEVRAGIRNSSDRDEETRFGWALGAGFEWAFAPRWSLKAEYLHVDLGDRDHYLAGGFTPTEVDLTADIVRVGVNYNLGPDFWRNVLGWR